MASGRATSISIKKAAFDTVVVFMIYQFIKPSPLLSRFIRHYWVLETDTGEASVRERVIPTGNIEIMFHYRTPFCRHKESRSVSQPRSFVSGISGSYMDVSTSGASGVIAATFYPWGACNFFTFPLVEIENRSVSLGDIFGNSIKIIEERICLASSLQERIDIIEQFLVGRLTAERGRDGLSLIKQSISLINGQKGQCRTSELASQLHLTEKTLLRKFSSLVGKTPKQFCRIVRFQEVIRSLSTMDKALTRQAYTHGFFDQAHFIKDFKTLSGYTPSQLLARGPCRSDYFG